MNGSVFHTKHWSVPIQGQCESFKHSMPEHTYFCLFFPPLNSYFLFCYFLFVTGLGPELEELMVEGFLLQVTLPETEQLYRYLFYKLAPLPSRSSPSSKKIDQDQSSPRGSPHKKVMINMSTFLVGCILTRTSYLITTFVCFTYCRIEIWLSKKKRWTVRAKRPSDGRKAQTLNTVRRPRSVVKRSLRKARRGVKKPGGLLLPHRQCLTLHLLIRRRTTHCVQHLGVESQRVTRFVLSTHPYVCKVVI